MAQVADKLSLLKMTQEERNNYFYYQKQLFNDRDELKAAEAKGEIKGIKKTAINLLKEGADVNFISRVTGLSTDEIVKIKNKMQIN